MSQSHVQSLVARGFTLIELLVVVAIIALLISILMPSLQGARQEAKAVVCMTQLDQLCKGIGAYQTEYNGWLPQSYNDDWGMLGSVWSEAAWYVKKKDLWFYHIVPKYMGNPDALACPGDPLKALYDFEAKDDITRPACGYGLNYILRHFSAYTDLMNISGKRPVRPAETILLAEVGPDDDRALHPLFGSDDTGDMGFPWRDGGRIIWDDGKRPWYDGPTWLTARHRGKINMAAHDLSVKRVPTRKQLKYPLQERYRFNSPFGDCYGFAPGGKWTCLMCARTSDDSYHYTFVDSNLWWWVGPIPDDPTPWNPND